ncbi:NAD(P)-dependent oxidoreductase [Candidatus Woesearchaeota archaeon]|nr:NAD(P)-dependent oxidoreductase [Candidatus Woesearchaeota archaeon]
MGKLNILVTGGNGFIGSHLLEKLGDNVIALVRPTSDLSRISHLNVEKVLWDDYESVFTRKKIDLVLHLATRYIKIHKTADEAKEILNSNVLVPSKLLEVCARNKVKFFINTGTFFEYKESAELLNEKSERQPFNLYAASKISFEEILKHYSNNGMKCLTLRLFSPYGEKSGNKVLIQIIKAGLRNEEITLYDGNQKLNWTYVEDIVSSYLDSIKYIRKMKTMYDDFNICSDSCLSLKEVIPIIENVLGMKIRARFIPLKGKEIFFSKGDNTKTAELMGWKPNYSFEEGIKKTIEYYKERLE